MDYPGARYFVTLASDYFDTITTKKFRRVTSVNPKAAVLGNKYLLNISLANWTVTTTLGLTPKYYVSTRKQPKEIFTACD